MSKGRSPETGLSLIEVLVSLAIFALIGIAGLAVLNTVARTGERTDGRLDRLAELDRAFLVISRDLAQVTWAQMTLGDDALAFQRTGAPRPFKITLSLQDTTMIRRVDLGTSLPVDQHLLSGVATIQWRLLDHSKSWHAVWPPVALDPRTRPLAAELTLGIWRDGVEGTGSLTRLFPLPAGRGK